MIRTKNQRVSEDMIKELDDIKVERIKLGIDKRMIGTPRLTRRIVKEPEWASLKTKLIKMPRDPFLDRRLK